MHIIQMRIEEDAPATEEKLRTAFPLAHLWHFPLAQLHLHESVHLPENVHGIVTSKNGIRWLQHHQMPNNFPLACVGKQTASLAKEMGYDISYQAKNVAELIPKLCTAPKDTKFMYFRGDVVRHDIKSSLASYVYYQEYIAYHLSSIAQAFEAFPRDLYGQKLVFLSYAQSQSLALYAQIDWEKLNNAMVIAISEHAAKPLYGLSHVHVYHADIPSEEGMIAHLKMRMEQ